MRRARGGEALAASGCSAWGSPEIPLPPEDSSEMVTSDAESFVDGEDEDGEVEAAAAEGLLPLIW